MRTPCVDVPGIYCLPDTTCFDMIPARGGEPYRIFVMHPVGDAPPDGWSILYLTDGNALFPMAAAAHAIQSPYTGGTNIQPGIIVAIGYPSNAPFDLVRRARDLTPPPGRIYPPYSSGGPDVVTGGADEFLDFIETELKPCISTRFPIDPARQTLFGHSFGGLFSLYALFKTPKSFARYVAASPSIFWEDCCLLDFEKQFSLTDDQMKRFLYLSAGEFEGEKLPPFQAGASDAGSRLEGMKKNRTAAYAREMADRLAAMFPESLIVRHETFAGENHLSVLPAAIGRAIQIAFEPVKSAAGRPHQ